MQVAIYLWTPRIKIAQKVTYLNSDLKMTLLKNFIETV